MTARSARPAQTPARPHQTTTPDNHAQQDCSSALGQRPSPLAHPVRFARRILPWGFFGERTHSHESDACGNLKYTHYIRPVKTVTKTRNPPSHLRYEKERNTCTLRPLALASSQYSSPGFWQKIEREEKEKRRRARGAARDKDRKKKATKEEPTQDTTEAKVAGCFWVAWLGWKCPHELLCCCSVILALSLLRP